MTLISFPRSATGTAQRVHLARFIDNVLLQAFSFHGTVVEVDLETMKIGVLLDVQPAGAEPIRLVRVKPEDPIHRVLPAVLYVSDDGLYFGVWN